MENFTVASLIPVVTQPQTDDDIESLKHALFVVRMICIVVNSVASLLGTVGNGLVIFFTVFRMKKTVNIVWFLNLAIADFIVMFILPFSVVSNALDYWPFGGYTCKLYSAVIYLNLFASVFLLTVISVDRYICIVLPVWSRNHRTLRLASIIALMTWILAFTVSLTYFIFRGYRGTGNTTTCYTNFTRHGEEESGVPNSRHKAVVVTRFFMGFAIPFTLFVSCYTIILLRIRRNHMIISSKPFKIILAVIISFFVCWFPYHILYFLRLFGNYHSDHQFQYRIKIGRQLAHSLIFINSCINPFLYVFICRDFKVKFWTSLQIIFEKAFMEDSVQPESKSKDTSGFASQEVLTENTLPKEEVLLRPCQVPLPINHVT